ncbi:hypothetical protein V6N13_096842 [Hibiscus sabdariffa]
MSFSSSEERLTFYVLHAPFDYIGVDFGWVAVEKLVGWIVMGCVLKKAASDGNWKQRKLKRELWNTFVSSIGTASSERASGGDGGGVGAEPKGESGAEGSAYSDAGGVGMNIWMGVASATSIFLMYSFRVQPGFSTVYLSPGRVGTAALRQRAEMMQGNARIPLSFWQAADISRGMTSPTLN